VREIIHVKNLSSFQKFLKLCAGRVGQILNLSSIGNDLGISHTTIREWLSVLETSYIVYLLPAYYRNFKKRIVKSPKLYFHDVGLASYLLGIESSEYMSRDSLRGNLFENYVVTETIKHFWSHGRNAPLYFFRDNIGNEVDLLIEKARQVAAIEIKAGQTVNSDWFKGLEYLKRVMGKTVLSRHLVYAGKEEYVREGTQVLSFRGVSGMVGSIEK
jgi:predicted AAA+ superfamily ATPase